MSRNPKARRIYEMTFICPGPLVESEVEKVIDQVLEWLRANDAEVSRVEKWGKRKLAYEVKKNTEGWYVLLHVNGPGAAIQEIERRMRLNEQIIKFLTVRVDDVPGAIEASEERIKRRQKMEEERAVRAAEKAAREQARKDAADKAAEEEAAKPSAPSSGDDAGEQEETS